MSIASIYSQYGVPNEWAEKYATLHLAVASFKILPKALLASKFHLSANEIEFVKSAIKRKPIDAGTVELLLRSNRYTCCICRGQKSKSFILHHIKSYSKTQDNSYSNLAVLCLEDHDLVHREGQGLTQKITADEVLKAKISWEKRVEELDVQTASAAGIISDTDFINAPRVTELYQQIFKSFPSSPYEDYLQNEKILLPNGEISQQYLNAQDSSTPFMRFAGSGAWHLSEHYIEAFRKILASLQFVDLDDLLNKKTINAGIVGKYCYYVGGLYGKLPAFPLTKDTPPTHLYFHRRDFWIEWMVDPQYMVSKTALYRLADRNQYIVYGVIRNLGTKIHKEKSYIHIHIRPYLFGIPTRTKSRRPYIHSNDAEEEFGF